MTIFLEKSPYQYHFGPKNVAEVLQSMSLGIGKRKMGMKKSTTSQERDLKILKYGPTIILMVTFILMVLALGLN